MAEQNNQNLTEEQEKEEGRELRRQQSIERVIKKREVEGKTKREEQTKMEGPGIKKGIGLFTAQALKTCWGLIGTTGGIIGGLIGLAYVNLHFIAKYLFGLNFFCEFGDETGANKITGGVIKWFEIIALFFLDFLVLALFFLSIIIILLPFIITGAAVLSIKEFLGF